MCTDAMLAPTRPLGRRELEDMIHGPLARILWMLLNAGDPPLHGLIPSQYPWQELMPSVYRASVRPGPGPITVRFPLLQSRHRRPADPATDAAHAQEESEETNACDDPRHTRIQLSTPLRGRLRQLGLDLLHQRVV
jgi:hypothetical protein